MGGYSLSALRARGEIMRIILACLASIIVPVIALDQVGRADAATSKKTPLYAKRYIKPNETSLRGNPTAANSGYHERILDRVPFGTQLWWRVYHSYPRN